MDVAGKVWEMLLEEREHIGELLGQLDVPLLLCRHKDCLVFTPEGFEDAVGAFPDAQTIDVGTAPPASDEFAAALRDFCEGVIPAR
jgi:hypothetical protein